MATIVEQAKAQMAKSVESTKENFSGIRTGRANPALLNGITVDYYGAPTPLKAIATIGVPEPRTLSVTPFDASQANAVEKALRDSDLGASPRRDGNVIRLTRPSRTARWVRTRAIVCSRSSTRSPSRPLMNLIPCSKPSRRRSWRSERPSSPEKNRRTARQGT